MYHNRKIEEVVSSGYAFLKQITDSKYIYENKFTGLRLLYDFDINSYKVLDGAI